VEVIRRVRSGIDRSWEDSQWRRASFIADFSSLSLSLSLSHTHTVVPHQICWRVVENPAKLGRKPDKTRTVVAPHSLMLSLTHTLSTKIGWASRRNIARPSLHVAATKVRKATKPGITMVVANVRAGSTAGTKATVVHVGGIHGRVLDAHLALRLLDEVSLSEERRDNVGIGRPGLSLARRSMTSHAI
jgi:hypothetical protein